jgi:hypothetical protein
MSSAANGKIIVETGLSLGNSGGITLIAKENNYGGGKFVHILGSKSVNGESKQIYFASGSSKSSKSGGIYIMGNKGMASKNIVMMSGDTNYVTGEVIYKTGNTLHRNNDVVFQPGKAVKSGDIIAFSGSTYEKTGGKVNILASGNAYLKSDSTQYISGSISMASGQATRGSSGEVSLKTSKTIDHNSGVISLMAGMAYLNAGGSMKLNSKENTRISGGEGNVGGDVILSAMYGERRGGAFNITGSKLSKFGGTLNLKTAEGERSGSSILKSSNSDLDSGSIIISGISGLIVKSGKSLDQQVVQFLYRRGVQTTIVGI